MRYLLNDAIEFDPGMNTLTAFKKSDIVVSLNAPVSRCLQLLIEKRYETVSQQDFYPYVWGESGNMVSVNTLYQNIALLRKALKMFDEQGNQFVMTVPKLGFSLSVQVSVVEMANNEEEHVCDTVIPSSAAVQIESVVPTRVANMPAPPAYKENLRSAIAHPLLKKILWPALPALLFIVMSVQIALWGLPHVELSNVIYKSMPTVSGCKIFSSNIAIQPEAINEMINEKLINCSLEPWLYIIASAENTHLTMLSCQYPLESSSPPKCRSLSLWGKPH